MINRKSNLLTARNLPPQLSCGNQDIQLDSELFIEDIANGLVNGIAQLPANPGFEKHPYKEILENSGASKYIIGTFPPISYLIDTLQGAGHPIQWLTQPTHPHQPITKPNIPFFHGNVSGLWRVLLPLDTYAQLQDLQIINREVARDFLINWLSKNNIYYDDIVSFTQRMLGNLPPNNNLGYTYEDVNLKNICPDINLVEKLLNNTNLDVVCFTNGATFRSGNNGGLLLYEVGVRQGLVRIGNADALSLFLRTCQDLGLQIEMRCMPHFDWTALQHLTAVQKRTKLIFELRITKTRNCTIKSLQFFNQKSFTAITPYSPAAHGTIEAHPIVLALRQAYGINQTAAQLLPIIYTHFRNNNYQDLFEFNINQ